MSPSFGFVLVSPSPSQGQGTSQPDHRIPPRVTGKEEWQGAGKHPPRRTKASTQRAPASQGLQTTCVQCPWAAGCGWGTAGEAEWAVVWPRQVSVASYRPEGGLQWEVSSAMAVARLRVQQPHVAGL